MSTESTGAGPRDATRGGVNCPALPGKRGRESPLSIDVTVVGAGMAGSEAAWQLAEAGLSVALVEMKPCAMSPAHQSPLCGELVCSNSLRSDDPVAPAGLLKHELRRCGSLVIGCADQHRVPAGQALAVERFGFARAITRRLALHPRIRIERRRLDELPDGPVIVCTGPLTEGALGEVIRARARRRSHVLLRRDRADRGRRLDRLGLRVPRLAVGPRRRRADPNSEDDRAAGGDTGVGDYVNCPLDQGPSTRRSSRWSTPAARCCRTTSRSRATSRAACRSR